MSDEAGIEEIGKRLRAWAEVVIADMNPEALFFEGPGDSDRAIVGIATKGPGVAAIVYDQDSLIAAMIEEFREDGDMADTDLEQSAWDWLEFNTKGAWVGESTPWVLMRTPHGIFRDAPPG